MRSWNAGSDAKFEINIGSVAETRKWLLTNMNYAVKGSNFDTELKLTVIRTLIASAFFNVKKRSKKCGVPEFKVRTRLT